MERWTGKVAVVTGASSGIGAAIAVDLTRAGMIVIGLARRPEKVLQLRGKLSSDYGSSLTAIKCDVSKEEEIKSAFQFIEKRFGGVDVLINNAGIVSHASILDENNTESIKSVIDTNLVGVILCTREAFRLMKKRKNQSHVILINSTLGQNLGGLTYNSTMNVYSPTKYAITALTEVYRQEFINIESTTKISSISPGWVETEILELDKINEMKRAGVPFLKTEDISQAVLYVLGTPEHVEVHELLIKPRGEKYL